MDAAVAALLGAAIGTAGTFGAAWIQQKHQTRRDLVKCASDMAIRDFERELKERQAVGKPTPPLSLFVAYHVEVLNAIADGTFGPEVIADIDKRQIAALKAIAAQVDRVPVEKRSDQD